MTSLAFIENLEVLLTKSKLESDVVKRIVGNFKQNIISVDDIFQIVVVDEDEPLSFITVDFFNSMDFQNQLKLFNVLSVVYEKIVLLNLSRLNCFYTISLFLVSHQYNDYVNGGQMKTKIAKVDNKIRLDLITRCVDIIMDTVLPQDHYQCDDKFLFLLKTISKNLFLMGSSKYKLLDRSFPIDSMEYSLNIFIMIHQNQPNIIIFKLALNKVDIVRMLERFQLSLRNHNNKDNIVLLESYFELTELETKMTHFRKRLELFWRLKMIPASSSISFLQLMTRLHNILTYKIMTEIEVLGVRKKVEKKFEAFAKRNPEKEIEKIRMEITDVNDKNRIKYKDMLRMYYTTSNCDNKNNKITLTIRSAEERVIRTPFDQFAFTLCLILKSDFYSTSEMEDWRFEIQQSIKERVQPRRFDKSPIKKFNRWLNRNTNRIRNTFALGKIMGNITSALEVDVENCDDSGFLVIRRALYVIGEFTKLTSNTKNISKELSSYMKSLHQCLSMGSPQKIRDMLSHKYSLYSIKRRSALKPADYKDMQSDLQNLEHIFNTMYKFYIPNIVRQFNGTLYNCKSDIQANSLLDYMYEIGSLILPASPYSSDVMELMDDVQNNLIPTLNTVTFDDPRTQENFSRVIQNLASVTNGAFEKSTTPPLKFSFDVSKYVMRFSNLIKLRMFLKQFLHTNSDFIPCSFFNYDHYISVSYRLFYTILNILNGEKKEYDYESILKKIRFTMSTVEMKYALFLKIDQMKQFLDSEKNNPVLELDILRSLDEIYADIGVSQKQLQKHDEYKRAIEELMKKLFTHTSIFEIKEKYEALEKYFATLGRKFNDQLQVLKTKEEQYIQQFLDDKISLALRLVETRESRFETGREMLLLEILDILHVRNIRDNLYQLDEMSPVLCGNNMRNYLAHGNISYGTITFNKSVTPLSYIDCNLVVIRRLTVDHFKLFDLRSDAIEVPKCKNDWNFDEQLKFIEVQTQLEDSVRMLNLTKLRVATRNGAFFDGRNHRGHNIFEVFLNHHLQIYEKYENDKGSLPPEQLEFVEVFFSLLSPDCRLNGKYPERPRNIFKEAVEGIAKRARDAIEMDILQFACLSGSIETVKLIIDSNLSFNLNRADADGKVPLTHACLNSHLDVISLLLERIEIIDLDKILCKGLRISNDIRVFEMIIPKCRDVNVTIDAKLFTLLFLAVEYNCDLNIITYLIDRGVNKAHLDVEGNTLTHIAVSQNRVDVVKYLIAKGFDCNVKNINKVTPLYIACAYGYLGIIEMLLEYCKINTENVMSCLVEAMHDSPYDIVIKLYQKYKTLFDNGAFRGQLLNAIWMKRHKIVAFLCKEIKLNPYLLHLSFFHSIISHDHDIFKILANCAEKQQLCLEQTELNLLIGHAAICNNFEIIEKLIKMGADYTQKNRSSEGCTILHSLAENAISDTRALRFFINVDDPGLNRVDNREQTPLFHAVVFDNIVTVYLLLKAGADVKVRNHKDTTVLHVACQLKNLEMIELLVRYGAGEQILWKDLNDRTPLDWARMGEHEDALISYLEKLELTQQESLNKIPIQTDTETEKEEKSRY